MRTSSAWRWFAVAAFGFASTWNYLDRSVLSAAAPRIEAEFHLSLTGFAWVISAFSIAYAVASPMVGLFLDWLGLEAGIVCAVGLWSLASALCGWSSGFGQLVGARVMLGAFESAGVPAAGKLNAIYLEPRDRAIGAAVTQVGLTIGGMGAPLLVAKFTGWRSPFFVCAALGAAWIPVWMLVRRNVRPYAVVAPQRLARPFAIYKDPRLLTLAVANVFWMGIYSLWSNWTTVFLNRSFHLNVVQAASYAWIPPAALTAGAFAGGWISKHAIARGKTNVEARVFAVFISAVGCLSALLVPLCNTPIPAMMAAALSCIAVAAGSVNLYTIPVDIWGGEHAGTAISALVFAYGIMQTGISPLIAWLWEHHGFAPVCWLVALPPMVGWFMLRRLPLMPDVSPFDSTITE